MEDIDAIAEVTAGQRVLRRAIVPRLYRAISIL